MTTKLGILFLTLASSLSMADVFTLDFDSVALSPGQFTSAGSYLNSYGISFVSLSNGASPAIFNVQGSVFTAASAPNVFAANGNAGNAPLSYELVFSQPLVSFTFTRVTEANTSTLPPYTISALDSHGIVLSSFSEPFQFGSPAVTQTLFGPGIAAIRLDANNSVGSSLTDPFLDNLVLTTATPEPGSAVALAACLAGLLLWKSRLRS